MRHSEIYIPAQLWNITHSGIDNPALKKGFQLSHPATGFSTNSKTRSLDNKLPHGTLLGKTSEGVAAYSNDSADSLALEPCRVGNTVTGLPWQCVEFARRWLLQTQDLIFADIPIAADIWGSIDYLTRVSGNKTVPLDSHPNGSHSKPEKGDLLIYSEAFLGTGHVAVVVGYDSEAGVIQVAEQNYSDLPWQGDYCREIPLIEIDGYWWLLEPSLSGWKRASKIRHKSGLRKI